MENRPKNMKELIKTLDIVDQKAMALITLSKEMHNKLQLISRTLKQFESNVDNVINLNFTNDYWQGRKDVLYDIREKIGSLEEYENGETSTGRAASAAPENS